MSATETQLEAVRAAVEPAVAALGLALYDVEMLGGAGARTLRVTVTQDGGVDLETVTAVTHAVSPIVDDATNVGGAFLLEVSSPGIERTLRLPAHYSSGIGEQVSVKFHTASGPRRVHGTLRSFDGTVCAVETDEGVVEEIAIADVTQARTVFEWGPQPRRPGGKHTKSQGHVRAKGKS